ncbi:MAG: SDR family oxidoreductase [Candidatus Zixiibacteriota bacterium]
MRDLADKTVVITGASRGIGASIALAFAREKCRLVLCGRDRERLGKVAEAADLPRSRVLTVTADISKPAGIKRIVASAVRKYGRIDVFINNAAIGYWKAVSDTTQEEFDHTFNTNLRAVFLSFRELIPLMKKQGGGQIINISSMSAKQAAPEHAAYAASKAALNILSESTAAEVRNDNIKICVLAPGSVATDFGGTPLDQKSTKPRLLSSEVADAVVFLARQNENAWVSLVEMRTLVLKKK